MAAKTNARKARRATRKAGKPRAPKRSTRRTTRRAVTKAKAPMAKKSRTQTKQARRASMKPKAPKRTRKAKKTSAKKKARKATKAKKTRKPKRITKKMMTGSYRQVWNGTKKYTKGGLQKADLKLNKNNKVVSKRRRPSVAALGVIKSWNEAFMKARKDLDITGFVALNRGPEGIKLYKLAKSYHSGTPQ